MYGGEAGWGFKLFDILTIRPQVGLGNVAIGVSGNVSGMNYASTSSLYVEPGVTGLLAFGVLFVGADANVLVLTQLDESNAVFTAHGQLGVKF